MRECFLLGAVDYLTEPTLEEDVRSALMRAAKNIGKKLMDTEYSKAVKQVLGELTVADGSETFVEKLRELLEKTQGTAVTVETAADHFGYNPDYFGRYFRRKDDPYLETREREEKFVAEIVAAVERSAEKALPSFLAACIAEILNSNGNISVPAQNSAPAEKVENDDISDVDLDFIGG